MRRGSESDGLGWLVDSGVVAVAWCYHGIVQYCNYITACHDSVAFCGNKKMPRPRFVLVNDGYAWPIMYILRFPGQT